MVEYYVALTLNLFGYRSARHGQYYAWSMFGFPDSNLGSKTGCSGSRFVFLSVSPGKSPLRY
jgi:hypothetical protein